MPPSLLILVPLAWAAASPPGDLFDSSSVAGARSDEMHRRAAVERSLRYDTGTVDIGPGLATLRLPAGYRYLDPVDADRMLAEIWGNLPGEATAGLIVPAGVQVTRDPAWVILLRHDTSGYVTDAKGLPDPETLMEAYREVEETRNEDRMGANNPRKDILAWVEPPVYDTSVRTLHWAVETRRAWFDGKKFLEAPSQIEYGAGTLGRRGVIRLEVAGTAGRWEDLKAGMTPLLASIAFQPGFRHADFDAKEDRASGLELQDLVTGLPLRYPGGFAVWVVETVMDYGRIALIGLALLIGVAVRLFLRTAKERKAVAGFSERSE